MHKKAFLFITAGVLGAHFVKYRCRQEDKVP